MKQTSRKTEQLMTVGWDLVQKYGMRRITVTEICETAGVSKMTFYKSFRNKSDFICVLLERLFSDIESRYDAIMQENQPFVEKISQIIQLKLEVNRTISKEFLADFLNSGDQAITRLISDHAQKNFRRFMADFQSAQRAGEVNPGIKAEFIFYFLNHLFDMLSDPQLMALYNSTSELTEQLTSFFFYGIMPPPELTGGQVRVEN